MKKLILLLTVLLAPVWGFATVANRYNVTSFPVTVTSTTAGNSMLVVSDGTVNPASVQFSGGSAFTLYACDPDTVITHLCIFFATNIAAGKTSITCTTCGTVYAVHAWELSADDNTNFIDHVAPCYAYGQVCNAPANALAYNPGYSVEDVFYVGNCTGSASSFSGSGVTWTAAYPNGEPGADGHITSAGQITGAPNAGCNGNTGMIIGVKAASANQACTADVGHFDYGTLQGSSGNPTVTATIFKTGSLIAIPVWCISGCTVSSVTAGSDTATNIGVSGGSDANAGQPYIYYKLSTGVSGSQTITATISGTRTGSQVAYQEFIPSGGCTFSHDVDAGPSSGTGATVITPSITPSAGDVVFNFTPVQSHTTSVNSPWLCNNFAGSGETGSCFFVSTVNTEAFLLGASGSAIANNLTQLNSAPWQGIMTSFRLSGSGSTQKRHRAIVIQ